MGAGAAAAFAASSPAPVAGGGQPPIRGNASGSGGGGGGGGPRRRSTRRLLALLLVLLTLLLLAGIAFASPPGQKLIGNITGTTITATVTITPNHPTVSDSFVVTAVTGTPNPTAQQVQARVVNYTSPSQSASANATGSLPGANATGTLTFAQYWKWQVSTISGRHYLPGQVVCQSPLVVLFLYLWFSSCSRNSCESRSSWKYSSFRYQWFLLCDAISL